MHKKKISVVLDNEFVLRSYLESPALRNLNLEFDVELVLIDQDIDFVSIKHINLSTNLYLQFIKTILSVSYWVKKRGKSNSFRIRLLSLLHCRRYFYSSPNTRFRIPSVPVLVGFIVGYLRLRIPSLVIFAMSRKIVRHFRTTGTNLIIYVTSGGASSNSDVLSVIGTRLKIPTLVIVENWDNLTSKAVFNFKPDFLGVWGRQDLEASCRLHGFASNRVFEIGSPRVSKLIASYKYDPLSAQKILFAGGSTDFPFELEWLKLSISLASKMGRSLIYVPHPANYSILRKFESSEYELIFSAIPSQIVQLIKLRDGKSLPTLDFYTPIFQEAWVTISPYSTMLLESLLLEIPTLGIDFHESVVKSEGWASQAFEHFQNLESFKYYSRVQKYNELEKALLALSRSRVKGVQDFVFDSHPVGIQNYFYENSLVFDVKLNNTVRKIVTNNL